MAFAFVHFAVDKLAGEEIIAVSARLVDNLPGRVIYLTRGKGVILRQISIMEKIYAKCIELRASTMLTAGPGAHVPGSILAQCRTGHYLRGGQGLSRIDDYRRAWLLPFHYGTDRRRLDAG